MIPKEIILDGTAVRVKKNGTERYLCYVDGHEAFVPRTEFTLLAILILQGDLNGAIASEEFNFPVQIVPKYLWRLRGLIHKLLPDYSAWAVYERRRDQKYVLAGRPSMTIKVSSKLNEFDDLRAATLAGLWLAKSAKPSSHWCPRGTKVKAI